MTDIIDQLLQESEGSALDFKRDQYRFSDGASVSDKADLLKDILSFANSFRRSEAFIVLGIAAKHGGKKEIVGIESHLDDASLQQFVNFKTNRPIEFSYGELQYQGATIGIIRIPIQQRPFYLIERFGSIKPNDVWYRQGSSNTLANPDIVAMMRSGSDAPSTIQYPKLDIDVCDSRSERSLQEATYVRTNYGIADIDELPDYASANTTNAFGMVVPSLRNPNREYWRELAHYIWAKSLHIPFVWHVKNTSHVTAQNVRVTIRDVGNPDLIVVDEMPHEPDEEHNPYAVSVNIPSINSEHDCVRKGNSWRVTSKLGNIQPGMDTWGAEPLYLLVCKGGIICLEVQLSADNLPEPSIARFNVSIDMNFKPPLTVADMRLMRGNPGDYS